MGRWLSVGRRSGGGQQDAFGALGRLRSGLEGEGQHCLSCLALYRGQRGTLVSAGGLSPVDEVQSQNLVNAEFSAEKPAFGSVCTSGGGPGLQNQSVRATRPSVTSDLARPSDTAPENDSSVLAQCLALLT